MKNVTCDRNADAAYIQLRDSKIVESEEVSNGIVYDFDGEDKVVGIEILNLSKRTPEEFQKLSADPQCPLTKDDKASIKEFFVKELAG